LRIHLLTNAFRADALEAAVAASAWLSGKGIEVGADQDTARAADVEVVPNHDFGKCDLIIAFGGDGTLIKAAHLTEDLGTPILGVYYGRFGFVTQCTGDVLYPTLEEFLAGKSTIESRMMLVADIVRAGLTVLSLHALNEALLQRSATARMLTVDVAVDGHRLTSYPADGVIIATSTGSTAYNLSVGGPIVDPRVEAIILSALAPHTLSARPLVLQRDSTVDLAVASEGDAVLSADGQRRLHILSGDVVRIRKSHRVTNLVRVQSDDFLVKLATRLFWSQGLMGDAH
jgi:NAD+ kinase